MRILNRRSAVLGVLAVFLLLAIMPSYLRAFVVTGDSDAPAFITGDLVLANLAAYDLRFPYSSFLLARLSDPAPGDVVVCRLDDGLLTIKRVIAGPGAVVTLRGHRVTIDGVMLEYLNVAPQHEERIRRGRLGPVIQVERGNGPDVYVSFDPANSRPDDAMEYTVPEDSYFVLGSNRDASVDSRHFGPLPRDRVLGRVFSRL